MEQYQDGKKLYKSLDKNILDSEAIKENFRLDRWRSDSMYHTLISKIDNIFDQENIYYGIYEEMLSDNKNRELSEFIGIDFFDGMNNVVVNESRKGEELDF